MSASPRLANARRLALAVVVSLAPLAGCEVEDIVAVQGAPPMAGLCACDGVVGSDDNPLIVMGDLLSGASIAGGMDVSVSGDAFVSGSLFTRDLSVAGTLHTPVDAVIEVTGTDNATTRSTGVIDVNDACECGVDNPRDISTRVQAARDINDNATIALDTAALSNVQQPLSLSLPCGRFYLDGIGAAADVEVIVNGHVALFIGGDVASERSLSIVVAESGALELFVAGNLTITGALVAGGDQASVNLYVGGSGTLDLGGRGEIGGLLYAPSSELVAREGLEVWGPLFVRRLSGAGPVTVRGRLSNAEPPSPSCP